MWFLIHISPYAHRANPIPSLSMTPRQLLLFFITCCVPLVGQSTDSTSIHRFALPFHQSGDHISFGVLTLTKSPETWTIRAGFLNQGPTTSRDARLFKRSDFRLISADPAQSPLEATSIDDSLTAATPTQGLPPGLANVGTVVLPAPPPGEWALHVAGYPPISLASAKETTPSFPTLPKEYQQEPKFRLRSPQGLFNLIEFRIDQVELTPDLIRFHVRFTNTSRLDLKGSSGLSGSQFRLLTRERVLQTPTAVSKGLAQTLEPTPGLWPAGAISSGQIDFPRPPDFALTETILLLPAFPPVLMRWDETNHLFEFSSRTLPAEDSPSTDLTDLLSAEQTFREITTFWRERSTTLAAKELDSFLAPVTVANGTRETLRNLALSISAVPISSLEFHVPTEQAIQVSNDGTVAGLSVWIHYTLATINPKNVFASKLSCTMKRIDGVWHLDAVTFDGQPPFWLLGYRHMMNTKHFLVFHRGDATPPGLLAETSAQLESAYATLTGAGLPLDERYVVFATPTREDFLQLTGRDPEHFSGAASSLYREENGRILSYNQAMYINDSRLATLQNAWAMKDRAMTIRHELVHLALADQTRPFTPPWLVEGVAMLYAGQTGPALQMLAKDRQMRDAFSLVGLTRQGAIGAGVTDQKTIASQYAWSAATTEWLRRTHGTKKLLQFYADFGTMTRGDLLDLLEKRGIADIMLPGKPLPVELITLHVTFEKLAQHFNGLTLLQLEDATKRTLK
jgi:hypothetical protein